MFKYVINCRLYNYPEQVVHLALKDGCIHHIEYTLQENADVIFDAENRIAAPGLIDTHVHGAGGGNPTDAKVSSMHAMAKTLCKLGTTSFTVTSFYFPDSENDHLQMMSAHQTNEQEAECLGIHLEGPFINSKRKGGIAVECLSEPDEEVLQDVLDKTCGKLAIMTLAPELEGNKQIINKCINAGVLLSFGHTDADNDEAREGFRQGISLVTHLNNAMRKFHQDGSVPLPAILESGVPVQIISDGVHLNKDTIKYFYQIFGPERLICITDGIESCGLPDGKYSFKGKSYRSENGLAFYSDGSGMIGTSLSLFEIMMRFKKFTDCSLAEAIKTAAENPAICLGVDKRKGFVKEGYDADLIIINEDETLGAVIKSGELVEEREF